MFKPGFHIMVRGYADKPKGLLDNGSCSLTKFAMLIFQAA